MPSLRAIEHDGIVALRLHGLHDYLGARFRPIQFKSLSLEYSGDDIEKIVCFDAQAKQLSSSLKKRLGRRLIVIGPRRELYKDNLTLTGSPAWLLKPRKLSRASQSTLINVPVNAHSTFDLRTLTSAKMPLAYLPIKQRDLKYLRPSERVLVAPQFPEIMLCALSNARQVITAYPEVACAAQAMGTLAVVPPSPLTGRALHGLHFNKPAQDKALSEFDEALGGAAQPNKSTNAPPLSVCCIASHDYLSPLSGLVENLRRVHHGNIRFFILALDSSAWDFTQKNYSPRDCRVYRLEDLWAPAERRVLQHRPLAQLAYSCKSRLLDRVLSERASNVLYTDLDMYFFRSPLRLFDRLDNGAGALFFPHWNQTFENTRKYGMFNAGLMLVNERAQKFLRWWSALCLKDCSQDPRSGHFFDQVYLDLAIACFPQIRPYVQGDENIGCWSFKTLGVHYSSDYPGQLNVETGRSIGSLHVTGADPAGFCAVKFAWDQMIRLLFDSTDQVPPHHNEVWAIQSRYWPQVRRVDEIYRAIGTRIGVQEFRFPRALETFMVNGGQLLTKPWTPIRRHWRKRHPKASMIDPNDGWIQLQKNLLFRSQTDSD